MKLPPLKKLHQTQQAQKIEEDKAPESIEQIKPAEAQADLSLRERLDKLDELISSELGISPMTIDAIRSHVKVVMVDLKENPEYDAVLVDKDVHNILRFIRHVKDSAAEVQVTTQKKKSAKAAKGGTDFNIDAADLLGKLNLKGLGSLKT